MSTDYKTDSATEYERRAEDHEAVRHSVDRFELYRDDPISCQNVLIELSEAMLDFDRGDIANLARENAAHYRGLIVGQQVTEDEKTAMENQTIALFDYYRWTYDGTMPSFRQMTDAIDGATALGEPAQDFLEALENHAAETVRWMIEKAGEIKPMGSEILDILDAQASGYAANFGPAEIRQMADRFNELNDWDRANTLQMMSGQTEDANPVVADIMDEVAAQYRSMAVGVDLPQGEEDRKILKEATASVLGYYRWQQDGTMPENEELADTLLGAQSWGPHMSEYMRAVTIHMAQQLQEARS